MKTGVIIVAGGSGTRMGSGIPKQFLPLCGKEVLVWCLEKFLQALPESPIVVVLPQHEMARWQEICEKYGLLGTHVCCAGGRNRFGSVRNGLGVLGACDFIAVQDGVRPLLSRELIFRCIGTAYKFGTAIPVIEPVDSFRIIQGSRMEIIDRSMLRAVQTPQVFAADLLRKAYEVDYSPAFTDDGSVVERYGVELSYCQGEYGNIKITTPSDMVFAEALGAAGMD